ERGPPVHPPRGRGAHRPSVRAGDRIRVRHVGGPRRAYLEAAARSLRRPMRAVADALRAADRIAIVSHRDPDPDTIGSALALGLGLESIGKRVSWHCADPVPDPQRFLRGTERFTQEAPPEDVDLVVTVDFGSADRAKFKLPT